MKVVNIILKIVLTLILVTPILGAFGVFPAPTADLYNTPEAFAFIQMLMETQYINIIIAIVFVAAIIALWTKREALAALLILPITVNIIAFHAFLDGGLFTAGAVMGNVLLLLNLYFLYQQRDKYSALCKKA